MILNAAFYQFVSLSNLTELRETLKLRTREQGFRGTILLSEEGINFMVAGEETVLRAFIAELQSLPPFSKKFEIKEGFSDTLPFVRMLVKIKKEIIPLGRPEIRPAEFTAPRVEPAELKAWLDQGQEVVLLDTRNEYEIDHGTFKGARSMGLNHFRDFPTKLAEITDEIRDKKVVMFCTGGIRCEKATALALNENFKNVYQLEGGILKYFEQVGDAHYDGNCFVFDHRVAITPKSS